MPTDAAILLNPRYMHSESRKDRFKTEIDPSIPARRKGTVKLYKKRAYSRCRQGRALTTRNIPGKKATFRDGGGAWIRTKEGISQQIYSLPRLATSVPHPQSDAQALLQPPRRPHYGKATRRLSTPDAGSPMAGQRQEMRSLRACTPRSD